MKPLLTLLTLPSTLLAQATVGGPSPGLPMVINTWGGPFTAATDEAYLSLLTSTSSQSPQTAALDAVQTGIQTCEQNKCDGSVGPAGSPDELCESTQDALLMDGTTLNTGAVASLRRIRSSAVGVARAVLQHTAHSLLAGDLATAFAVENGFVEEDAGSETSRETCRVWREEGMCQPNYRLRVLPDAGSSCGPYVPDDGVGVETRMVVQARAETPQRRSHDTISMIALTPTGAMASGTSTNGASHKVPGRVGDGPIAGSGSYVDGEVGGCGATGDGDIMMRFLPCYQAVENLRLGMSPTAAAEDVVRRMLRRYPDVSSGIVVVDRTGRHGGAGSGWTFTYAFRGGSMNATQVVSVPPLEASSR